MPVAWVKGKISLDVSYCERMKDEMDAGIKIDYSMMREKKFRLMGVLMLGCLRVVVFAVELRLHNTLSSVRYEHTTLVRVRTESSAMETNLHGPKLPTPEFLNSFQQLALLF